MIKDTINVAGMLRIQKFIGDICTGDFYVQNKITKTGKDWIAARMLASPPSPMSHMAIGTGNIPTNAGQDALAEESGRVALTSSVATGNTITYTATFPAGVGTGVFSEAAIFNGSTAGKMLNRTVFGGVEKLAQEAIIITWQVTVQ